MSTVFLAWQSPTKTRAWYPIGRLDSDSSEGPFRYRYVRGAQKAYSEAGLQPLMSFPDLYRQYHSDVLFPLFRNRILSPNREDFKEYLRVLNLSPEASNPLEILAASEGRRQTDTLEVFPKLGVGEDGTFQCRFFLHGWRHVSESGRHKIDDLKPGASLQVAIEMNNPATGVAVQVQTAEYHMIGWAPRYLVHDLVSSIRDGGQEVSATVVRVNPLPAPSQQRVLIEMRGQWPSDDSPMSSGDFADIEEAAE